MESILVVDDQPEVREMLRDYLAIKGFEVYEAEHGAHGLEQMKTHAVNAALVDLDMPVMNGVDFSERVLAENDRFNIIIITAHLDKYSRVNFSKMGVKAVLQKPIDFKKLNKILAEIFN